MKKIVCIFLMLGASLKVMAAQATEKNVGNYEDLIAMHLEDEKPLAIKLKTLHQQDSRVPQLADIAQYNINYYGQDNINWHKLIEHGQQVALDPQGYIDQNSENDHDNLVYLYVDDSDKDNDENEEEYYYGQEEYEFQEDEEKEVDPRQEEIDLALKSHSYLCSGFDLFREKIGSFKKFLEQHLAYNDEDANYGEVIVQAKDVLFKMLVKEILRAVDLDSSYFDNESYRTLLSVIDYVMNHKDVNELEHRELLEELFKGITAQSYVYEFLIVIKDPNLRRLLMYIKSQEQGIVEQASQVGYDFEYFIQAIKNNEVGVVKRLLELHKIDLIRAGILQNSLYVAVNNGRTEIVRLLLAQPEIDVNVMVKVDDLLDKYKFTSLSYVDMSRFNDLDIRSNPLGTAVLKGYIEIVKLLLDHPRINLNKNVYLDGNYRTFLNLAIVHKRTEIEQLLRNAGAPE